MQRLRGDRVGLPNPTLPSLQWAQITQSAACSAVADKHLPEFNPWGDYRATKKLIIYYMCLIANAY